MKTENILIEMKALVYLLKTKDVENGRETMVIILSVIENIYDTIFKYENYKDFEEIKKNLTSVLDDLKFFSHNFFLRIDFSTTTKQDYFKSQLSEHLDFILKYLNNCSNEKKLKEEGLYLEIENMQTEIIILKKELETFL